MKNSYMCHTITIINIFIYFLLLLFVNYYLFITDFMHEF